MSSLERYCCRDDASVLIQSTRSATGVDQTLQQTFICVASLSATGVFMSVLGAPLRILIIQIQLKLNSVACSPQANYTDRAAAAC
jgi:hypothetical protein